MGGTRRTKSLVTAAALLAALGSTATGMWGCDRNADSAGRSGGRSSPAVIGNQSAGPSDGSAKAAVGEGRSAGGSVGAGARDALATASAPVGDTQPTTRPVARAAGSGVVVYYFHRTLRCEACLSIEEQSRNAIESNFSRELDAGDLEWRAVNIEAAGNEHFQKDFELERQSLVLVELEGEQASRYRKLERVWDLYEDPPALEEYVVDEVALFLAGG